MRLRVDARELGLGHRMSIAIYPLHIGAVGGTAIRWLTAFAGLMPARRQPWRKKHWPW